MSSDKFFRGNQSLTNNLLKKYSFNNAFSLFWHKKYLVIGLLLSWNLIQLGNVVWYQQGETSWTNGHPSGPLYDSPTSTCSFWSRWAAYASFLSNNPNSDRFFRKTRVFRRGSKQCCCYVGSFTHHIIWAEEWRGFEEFKRGSSW